MCKLSINKFSWWESGQVFGLCNTMATLSMVHMAPARTVYNIASSAHLFFFSREWLLESICFHANWLSLIVIFHYINWGLMILVVDISNT